MATKKKKAKTKPLNIVLVIILGVAYILMAMMFFMPAYNLGTNLSEETDNVAVFDMLQASQADNLTDLFDASENVLTAFTAFFADSDNAGLPSFSAIMLLVVAIVGIVGLVAVGISLAMPKLKKVLKPIGIVAGIVAIAVLVLGLIVSSQFSSEGLLVDFTVSLGIGTILAVVGGVLACVAPLAIKK